MEKKFFVFSVLGRDRVGMVDDISEFLVKNRCNIHESRMSVLGGEFAIIMLASAPADSVAALNAGLDEFAREMGCRISVKETSGHQPAAAGKPYILQAYSIDAPGIVHAVTSVLHNHGINIEDLTTDTSAAPWTGTPLFQLRAHIVLPAGLSPARLREALATLEQEKDLDIVIRPYNSDRMEK
ncbi:MAG: hypothetical protein JW874_09650 [Spirochaetales bacterium]|nr:hypothetical protein [Spirochaetales bacterium]